MVRKCVVYTEQHQTVIEWRELESHIIFTLHCAMQFVRHVYISLCHHVFLGQFYQLLLQMWGFVGH